MSYDEDTTNSLYKLMLNTAPLSNFQCCHFGKRRIVINPLNTELNPIYWHYYELALYSVLVGYGLIAFNHCVDVDWFAVPVTPMHLGLKLQALCAPLLVPSINSRGAPRHAGVKNLC
jgi:hypothetical protein